MSTATKNKPTETKPDPPKANAAAANANAPAGSAENSKPKTENAGSEAPAKRTRAGQSMEKRLAVAGINVLEVIDLPENAKFKTANAGVFDSLRTLTAEVNEKLTGPAKARITAIEAEMTAALEIKNYSQLATLAKELERLQKKIKG